MVGISITMFWFAHLNLEAGYWDIFWPQFFQGLCMGLIFVPLTTTTMSLIAREGMGNATSLFNLMRNLGGAIGIALCLGSPQAIPAASVLAAVGFVFGWVAVWGALDAPRR